VGCGAPENVRTELAKAASSIDVALVNVHTCRTSAHERAVTAALQRVESAGDSKCQASHVMIPWPASVGGGFDAGALRSDAN